MPRLFCSRLVASFMMASLVGFCSMSTVKPPPWIMKLGMIRWKIVPLKKPELTYSRKFLTVIGAFTDSSSRVMSPMEVDSRYSRLSLSH